MDKAHSEPVTMLLNSGFVVSEILLPRISISRQLICKHMNKSKDKQG